MNHKEMLGIGVALSLFGCASRTLSLAPESPQATSPTDPQGRAAVGAHAEEDAAASAVPWPPVEHRDADVAGTPQAVHRYSLTELIDVAQRNQPSTAASWQRARQAALAVGMTQAEHVPILSASLLAGYQHVNVPISKLLVERGYFTTRTFQVVPQLMAKWLLLDFGVRRAQTDAARELSNAANALHVGQQQKVVFDVCKGYFKLLAAQRQLRIGASLLEQVREIHEAVKAQRQQGLLTVLAESQAERELAQAEYNLVQLQAVRDNARAELLAAVGAEPSGPLEIEEIEWNELPTTLGEQVRGAIDQSLDERADLRAAVAKAQAAAAGRRGAISPLLPSVSAVGTLSYSMLGMSVDGSRFFNANLPAANAFLLADWTLFDGGLRSAHAKAAGARVAEAEAELQQLRQVASQQLVIARNEVQSSVARCRAADRLVAASETAADVATASFERGVATLAEALTARTLLGQAQIAREAVYAEAMVASGALVFASGKLTAARALQFSRQLPHPP